MTISEVDQLNSSFVAAEKLYKKQGFPKEKLFTDIQHYAIHHYAYFAPDCLILAKVIKGEDSDGWFIYLATGKNKLQRFFQVAPYQLPWIGFARPEKGRDTKWYSWRKLKRIVYGRKNTSTSGNT